MDASGRSRAVTPSSLADHRRAPALARAAKLVRSSHQAFDGTGYPDRLSGVEIALGARIIAVCDAIDAMISDRPYSKPRTTDQALAELRRCAGTQLDPRVVDVFEQVVTARPARGRRLRAGGHRSQSPTATAG